MTGHLRVKSFKKNHNSIHFWMPTSLWIRFQLGDAAKCSVSLMMMNLILFTQKFFEFNKKAFIFNILLNAFFSTLFLFLSNSILCKSKILIAVCNSFCMKTNDFSRECQKYGFFKKITFFFEKDFLTIFHLITILSLTVFNNSILKILMK